MLILGIETSCDETAVGLVDVNSKTKKFSITANELATQIALHAPYLGVVPELASRAHLEKMIPILEAALGKSSLLSGLQKVKAIAYTRGPGLKGSLLIGETTAKALALALGKPALGVHHLEAHLATVVLEHPEVRPPFLGLVVSGGHTDLVIVKDWGSYRVLGRTVDDACGEAFDKFAKMMRLGFPGGPAVDRLAREGNAAAVNFPRPTLGGSWNFSFSGLKTSALYWLRDNEGRLKTGAISKADVAASFQEAICETLLIKSRRAMRSFNLKTMVVSGGVAANSRLRTLFQKTGDREGWRAYFPRPSLCTDNGVMVAALGGLQLLKGKAVSTMTKTADTTLPFTKW